MVSLGALRQNEYVSMQMRSLFSNHKFPHRRSNLTVHLTQLAFNLSQHLRHYHLNWENGKDLDFYLDRSFIALLYIKKPM